jgi:hypothetical protein
VESPAKHTGQEIPANGRRRFVFRTSIYWPVFYHHAGQPQMMGSPAAVEKYFTIHFLRCHVVGVTSFVFFLFSQNFLAVIFYLVGGFISISVPPSFTGKFCLVCENDLL